MTADADEVAIASLPETAWSFAIDVDGGVQDGSGGRPTAHMAELTGLDGQLAHWPEGVRLIVRHFKLSRRHERKLAGFEKRTGWRYQILAITSTSSPTYPDPTADGSSACSTRTAAAPPNRPFAPARH